PMVFQHERGFDEIVAQDLAPERFLSRDFRQTAVLHKRSGANNGVMPDIIPHVLGPVIQAARECRRIEPARKLMQAAEKGFRIEESRRRLDDTHFGMCLHQLDESYDGPAGDKAICIKHDKVAVAITEIIEEIPDVAALFRFIPKSPSIKDPAEC